MAIPLPALDVRPPEQQPGPLDQYAKAVQLKSLLNAQQYQQQAQPLELQQRQQALDAGQLEIQQRKQQLEQTQALNDAYKTSLTVDPNSGKPTFNRDAVIQSAAASGHGAVIPQLTKTFNDLDEQAAKLQEAKDKHQVAASDYFGSIAAAVRKSKDNPQVFATLMGHAASEGGYGPQADALLQQVSQNPDSIHGIVDQALAASPTQRKLAAEEMTAQSKQAGANKPTEASLAQAAQQGDTDAQGALDKLQGAKAPTEVGLAVKASQGDPAAQLALKQLTAQHAAVAAAGRDPNVAGARVDARLDRSFQYNNTELDKVGKPIEDALGRLGRLKDTLAQGTPQADALVAPELLSVMAGGAGSGLRMNEAEISRIVGGRSKWENLKAAAQQWSLDPSKANSITPEQRQQIHGLLAAVDGKLTAKQQILDQSRQQLGGANDPGVHRKIVADTRSKLTSIDQGQASTVQVKDPSGGIHTFPDQASADNFKKLAHIQ